MTTDQTVGLWGINIWRTFSGCALFANGRVSIFSRRGCCLQVKNVVAARCRAAVGALLIAIKFASTALSNNARYATFHYASAVSIQFARLGAPAPKYGRIGPASSNGPSRIAVHTTGRK